MKKANKIGKMNTSLAIAALCVATAAVTLPAQAGPDTATGQGQTYQGQNQTQGRENQREENQSGENGQQPGQIEKVQKASNLVGANVENREGDKLGKIENVVVDFNSGKVAYCVMEVDHGLFSQGKYLAIPLTAFQPSANGNYVILNADKNKVAQARGFDHNDYPAANSRPWGSQPFWQSPNGNNGNGTMNNNGINPPGAPGSGGVRGQ